MGGSVFSKRSLFKKSSAKIFVTFTRDFEMSRGGKRIKVFCFFFSKKKFFLALFFFHPSRRDNFVPRWF